MSLLEPMMAEEKNASSYDGGDGDSRTVFVCGKTKIVNIEGEKQYIIPQQDKTNMTGGRAGHVSGSVAQARYCTPLNHHQKKTPFVEWGGGQGVFMVASPKHGTARRLTTPLPHPHVREKSTLPKHGTARPLSPPKNPPIVEWEGGETGGVHRGGAKERHCKSPIPPPKKTTLGLMGGGGRGVQKELLKHGTARSLSTEPKN
jgi:hypothetical protein